MQAFGQQKERPMLDLAPTTKQPLTTKLGGAEAARGRAGATARIAAIFPRGARLVAALGPLFLSAGRGTLGFASDHLARGPVGASHVGAREVRRRRRRRRQRQGCARLTDLNPERRRRILWDAARVAGGVFVFDARETRDAVDCRARQGLDAGGLAVERDAVLAGTAVDGVAGGSRDGGGGHNGQDSEDGGSHGVFASSLVVDAKRTIEMTIEELLNRQELDT